MTTGSLCIPPRPPHALAGTVFCATIAAHGLGRTRERELEMQLLSGNVPSFLRECVPVQVAHKDVVGTFFVAPDYLAVGSDEDYVRVPLAPRTAARVAVAFLASLPTRKMVNAIWDAAEIKLQPRPLPPTYAMTSVSYFVRHNEIIQEQLDGRVPSMLVAGHKKDVVISKHMRAQHVAIYGWHQKNGIPIQGPAVQVSAHDEDYSDYSHGIRFVAEMMLVNGDEMPVAEVLRDPELSHLVSDEGPLSNVSYAL